MPGYPNKIARASLGPTVVDTWPVKDPRKAIPATTHNLQFWQVAGAQMGAARGIIGATVSGTTVTTDYQALAWDADGSLPALLWSYDAAGDFSFDFPSATYPDEAGNAVPLVIPFGFALARALNGSNLVTGQLIMTAPKAGRVRLRDIEGTADADVDFAVILI